MVLVAQLAARTRSVLTSRMPSSKRLLSLGAMEQGAEGLVGYLKMLGADYPQTYASLLHRMLPLQMSADVKGGDHDSQHHVGPLGHVRELGRARREALRPRRHY